jgi:hypothetical protein
VPIVQEAGWAPGPVGTAAENLGRSGMNDELEEMWKEGIVT